jgi:hypothetical protein
MSTPKEQRREDRQLVQPRIVVEHIHRLGLRLNLIAGIYNYELNWQQELIC